MSEFDRRSFLKMGALGLSGLGAATSDEALSSGLAFGPATLAGSPPDFKLGLVTYELAKDWDIETIIQNCEAAGFEGVELRTTHRHGVEPSISKERRA